MKAVQIVFDEVQIRVLDRMAKQHKINRSALVRLAVENLIKQKERLQLDERDRRGYENRPGDEFDVWNRIGTWPED